MISSSLPVELVATNIDDAAALNSNCGADYVKTGQRLPPAMTDILKPGQRACSLDGDADRVVFYYLTSGSHHSVAPGDQVRTEGKFRLLDGDKIATLAAGFIGDLVKQAGLSERLKIGVIQTAYANGSSTAYLKNAVSRHDEVSSRICIASDSTLTDVTVPFHSIGSSSTMCTHRGEASAPRS